jgi:hypothetical protein
MGVAKQDEVWEKCYGMDVEGFKVRRCDKVASRVKQSAACLTRAQPSFMLVTRNAGTTASDSRAMGRVGPSFRREQPHRHQPFSRDHGSLR